MVLSAYRLNNFSGIVKRPISKVIAVFRADFFADNCKGICKGNCKARVRTAS